MRNVCDFAGNGIKTPELFVAPLIDRSIENIRGVEAQDQDVIQAFQDHIRPELTASDHIRFTDIPEGDPQPDLDKLIDRFEDITGLYPGNPTVKFRDADSVQTFETFTGTLSDDDTAAKLKKFYQLTGLRPNIKMTMIPKTGTAPDKPSSAKQWGADSNMLFARIRMPRECPSAKSFLHELGHCATPWVGFKRDEEVWDQVMTGLTYAAESDGEERGEIVSEAIGEGLGTLVNRRLNLVPTFYSQRSGKLPEMVSPYIKTDSSFANAAPAAIALELIAQELDIPSDRYFRMFANYANSGMHDIAAREQLAETVSKGTLGRLTLGQIEELPYPTTKEASLALLWAVEDVLEVPANKRYADFFFNRNVR